MRQPEGLVPTLCVGTPAPTLCVLIREPHK
jgi:hypothetical protein